MRCHLTVIGLIELAVAVKLTELPLHAAPDTEGCVVIAAQMSAVVVKAVGLLGIHRMSAAS